MESAGAVASVLSLESAGASALVLSSEGAGAAALALLLGGATALALFFGPSCYVLLMCPNCRLHRPETEEEPTSVPQLMVS